MSETPEGFEAWGIVDLFGHQRVAGRICEQQLGGDTFVRVDVPHENDGFHTRLFGKGAIYSISITDEAIARATASRMPNRPVYSYDLPALRADDAASNVQPLRNGLLRSVDED